MLMIFTDEEYKIYTGQDIPLPEQMWFDIVWFDMVKICPCLTEENYNELSDELKELVKKALMLQMMYYKGMQDAYAYGKALTSVTVGDYSEGYMVVNDMVRGNYHATAIDMLKSVFPNCSYWLRGHGCYCGCDDTSC